MGWVGRTIDGVYRAFAPRRWVMREHWRRMSQDEQYRDTVFAALRARGYRSASTGDRTPWLGGLGRSADAEILWDLPTMRSRSRELNRDDSLASGLTKTFVTNVIGRGIKPQARTGDTEKDRAIEDVWRERAGQLHPQEDVEYCEAQQLKFRKVIEDGDVFVRKVYSRERGLWLEVVEADRVGWPIGVRASAELGDIRQGVERDGDGIPVRYWVRKYHPGDFLAVPGSAAGIVHSVAFRAGRIEDYMPIDPPFVRHLRRIERPGQTRGVPLFHAVTQEFRDLDLLIEATLKHAQIAACIAAFVKTDMPTGNMFDITARKYGFVLDQSIEPGMIMRLYPGESMDLMTPAASSPELFPFIRTLAGRIGASVGVTWQTVLRDFSSANYSSARTDLLADRQTFQVWQSWFVSKCLAWEWFEVLRDARDLIGDARLRGCTDADLLAVNWIAPGWQWVDPQKEAQATKIKLEAGLSTLRDELAAQGQDWEDVIEQQLREESQIRKRREELELPDRFNLDEWRYAVTTRGELDAAEEEGVAAETVVRGINGYRSRRRVAA